MSLHPSLAAVRGAVRRDLAGFEPGARLVVACSGGADSLALASATVHEGREEGWYVVGATVDHGLQEGSAERADQVLRQLAALGVDETVATRASVDAPGLGPEAAARAARYAVLDQIREQLDAEAVLLGHTRDDQAETVLMGLTRGSGGRAIAGMRRSFEHYRRPLLDVGHDDTVTACQVEGLEVWEDPHNADPAFTRVRVRRRVLPVLEDELGPGVAEALARTADQLRPDMELLDAYAGQAAAAAAVPGGLSVEVLAGQPAAIRTRVLRAAAVAAGAPAGETSHQHVMAVDGLVTDWHGQKWVDLPGHLRARRHDGVLGFEPAEGGRRA
ncbi:MAG TPA: tRNA lysidine(34) synthetase TilS [Nocardioides sp.]|uniref:tRNA lysidine(34) synthetase TilS n=1 Tax=Nocardioides sp. TaxID=35761 RepID=UPI002E3460B6|nr:tRNA lysidine(34) synthetase TilS [Nocardioides sp.]HEX3929514.1 tRNA lysidine(34) synthetase TilS [Nocardioides sp.]